MFVNTQQHMCFAAGFPANILLFNKNKKKVDKTEIEQKMLVSEGHNNKTPTLKITIVALKISSIYSLQQTYNGKKSTCSQLTDPTVKKLYAIST